jgi:hypothetical protein
LPVARVLAASLEQPLATFGKIVDCEDLDDNDDADDMPSSPTLCNVAALVAKMAQAAAKCDTKDLTLVLFGLGNGLQNQILVNLLHALTALRAGITSTTLECLWRLRWSNSRWTTGLRSWDIF